MLQTGNTIMKRKQTRVYAIPNAQELFIFDLNANGIYGTIKRINKQILQIKAIKWNYKLKALYPRLYTSVNAMLTHKWLESTLFSCSKISFVNIA